MPVFTLTTILNAAGTRADMGTDQFAFTYVMQGAVQGSTDLATIIGTGARVRTC